jgi:hypothetical protein
MLYFLMTVHGSNRYLQYTGSNEQFEQSLGREQGHRYGHGHVHVPVYVCEYVHVHMHVRQFSTVR